MADLKALAEAVIKGDANAAVQITQDALAEKMPAGDILNNGLVAGMDVIGVRFKNNEIYIPEVLIAARAMKTAMAILEPELAKAGVEPVGKFEPLPFGFGRYKKGVKPADHALAPDGN